MEFDRFNQAIRTQFARMREHDLYKVDVSKDDMWNTYLESFPPGSNPMFRKRTQHDCQCCKQFIRLIGNVVCFINDKKETIWDIPLNAGPVYNAVALKMAKLIKRGTVVKPFYHYENTAGTAITHGQDPQSGAIEEWGHFQIDLPKTCVKPKHSIDTLVGDIRTGKEVFKRTMEEITFDAVSTVLDLIDQKALYRGEENKANLTKLYDRMTAYAELSQKPELQDMFCWKVSKTPSDAVIERIRNTSIGILLVDLSENMPLEAAVAKFEAMVAPSNYKRPTALITQKMIDRAQKDAEELGYIDALPRRFARAEDISVNNVLFANRSTKTKMKDGAFDLLKATTAVSVKNLSNVEEISIDAFLQDILPSCTSIKVLMENRHQGNLMSLIAPVNGDAKNMFKWNNNFSWTYNGEIADSMKERVKAAGGNVTGILRFSLQWNESGKNNIDFDIHCHEPNGNHIYFATKGQRHSSSGKQDVDIVSPMGKVAVENITWSDERCMPEGVYTFSVHNYASRTSTEGFSCEIEYGGEIHTFEYPKVLNGRQMVDVAQATYNRKTGLTFNKMLPSTAASKEFWGVKTMQYTPVSMLMYSPNHWDGNQTGNRHMFFILEGCKQPGDVRGFYNEFLSNELNEHRKVFEMLGAKMRVPASDNQLSGLGFSSTIRNHVICKVSGALNRVIKIVF